MKYAVFDIEANEWIKLVAVGLYDGESFISFRSASAFLEYIDSKSYKNWRFYSHNGGRYDDLFLLEWLLDHAEIRCIERGGRVIAIYATTKKGIRLTFADSYALLPDSLENLSVTFRCKKKKEKYDFSKKLTYSKELL